MGFKKVTPKNDFETFLENEKGKAIQRGIYVMRYIGELCVSEARTNGNYIDRTGNLRNSIGYAVLVDGKIVEQFTQNAEGGQESAKLIQQLKGNFQHGVVLLVVAGMNYASHVESLNYDVITSAQLLGRKLVPQILKKTGFEVK